MGGACSPYELGEKNCTNFKLEKWLEELIFEMQSNTGGKVYGLF
jgi:hypothetical protein